MFPFASSAMSVMVSSGSVNLSYLATCSKTFFICSPALGQLLAR